MARTIDHHKHAEIAMRAFEAIRARGVHGTSMSQVAADLGMKRSSLYWYFGSLGEIFEAVLQQTIDALAEFVQSQVSEERHPIALVERWMQASIAFYDKDPELIAVLAQFWAVGSSDRPELVFDRTRAFFEPVREAGVALLRAGIDEGTVRPCDAESLIHLCAATVDGLLVHRMSHGLQPHGALELFCAQMLRPLALQGSETEQCSDQNADRTGG